MLVSVFSCLCYALASVGAGSAVLSMLPPRRQSGDSLLRINTAFVVGLGILTAAWTLLGIAGWLSKGVVVSVVLALAVVAQHSSATTLSTSRSFSLR